MARSLRQGDIHYATLSTNGSVQGGIRPVIIVQNNVGNRYSPTVTVIPLTSKVKSSTQPTHAILEASSHSGLKFTSMALGEQITTIPAESISKKIGRPNENELKSVWAAVLNQISLPNREAI